MIVLALEEFTAKRRRAQDDAIAALIPEIEKALAHWRANGFAWSKDLLEGPIFELFRDTVLAEAGEAPTPTQWKALSRSLRAQLRKTTKPDKHTASRMATWLSTAVINEAYIVAAIADPEPLIMEWVTMHDGQVRATHKAVDGEQRPVGEKFIVGGYKMRRPGDPVAPPSEIINCRCALRPVPASEARNRIAASAEFVSEKPWDGSASRFTDEQWKASCILHLADTLNKSDHKLPIKEPGGALSRAGVHAAAGRIGQASGPPDKIAAAKASLRGAYKQLGEDPPDSLAVWHGDDQTENPQGVEMSTATEEKAPPEAPALPVDGGVPWHGVLAPEGVESGDGRTFGLGSLSHRDLPLPLTYQVMSADGHGNAVVVGSIEDIEMVDNLMWASGVFLNTPEADEAVGMLAHFGKFGVSVDADDGEQAINEETGQRTFTRARVCSACIVPIPAFAEAYVTLGPRNAPPGVPSQAPEDAPPVDCEKYPDDPACTENTDKPTDKPAFGRGPGWVTNPADTKRIHDYWTVPGNAGYTKIGWGVPGDFNRCRVEVGEEIGEESPEKLRFLNQICAQWHHDALGFWPGRAPSEQALEPEGEMAPAVSLVASADADELAPAEFFTEPPSDHPIGVVIEPNGHVYGYIAEWQTCHVAYDEECVAPPTSSSGYAYFLTGEVDTTEGPVAVGSVTIGGGHAGTSLRPKAAVAHYDSTSAVVADVTCGENERGIWFSGMVRRNVDPAMVKALKAAGRLSGDWRKINGEFEMIAALAVNSGGFPIPRVGFHNGRQVALVAAGMVEPVESPEQIDMATLARAVAEHLAEIEANRKEMAELAATVGGQ